MHRVDAARQAIVRGNGQTVRLRLGDDRIGRHHANGGVGARQQGLRQLAVQQRTPGIGQAQSIGGAGARHRLRSVGVDHIAHRVAGNERAHGHTIDRDRSAANAALHGPRHAEHLAHAGPRARTDIALGRVGARGGGAGGVARCCIGPDAHVAHHQIEQHGRRHERKPAYANVQPHALLFQPAHGARGGLQAPGATAREHHGMHFFDQVAGVEQIGFTGSRRCAAHVHPGHGTLTGDHHAAARGAARVGEMSHLDPSHAGDAARIGGAAHALAPWW